MSGPLESLRQDPAWSACFDRLAACIQGLASPLDDPGMPLCGPLSAVEGYARAVSGASSPGVSLALTLPMTMTTATVAGQGAYWTRIKQPGGDWLPIPMIMQSTLIAPSGYGKSSSLDPLVQLLDSLDRQGHVRRHTLLTARRVAALGAIKALPGLDKAAVEDEEAKVTKIFQAGACTAGLTLDSSTPEGIRQHLSNSGSVAGILTAEPDILMEISKYSNDAGTFRWLLDGWGAAKVGVTRVKGTVVIPRTCLPYCILLQPVAFESFNTAQMEAGGGGIAADSAIGRGLYGRSWLVRIEGFTSGSTAFGLADPEVPGKVGGVLGAELALRSVYEQMMIRSDAYRVDMGLAIGWEAAVGSGEAGISPPQQIPCQIWLELGQDATWPYVQVQNLRLALMDLVQQLEVVRPGTDRLYMPMVTRWTQHVLRTAQILALTVDAATVDIPSWAIEDAALRICPWLLEHWCAEIQRYQEAATVALLESEIKNNARSENLTFEGRIAKAIRALAEEQIGAGIPEGDVMLSQGDVCRWAKEQVRRQARPELTNGLNQAFVEMVGKEWLSEIVVAASGSKGGKPVKRYKRTTKGRAGGL